MRKSVELLRPFGIARPLLMGGDIFITNTARVPLLHMCHYCTCAICTCFIILFFMYVMYIPKRVRMAYIYVALLSCYAGTRKGSNPRAIHSQRSLGLHQSCGEDGKVS